ncbi:hypothetical protein RMATCC62417_01869 [Rhizopus microsporus]|nr:hypothetical protein RMATCC62417_01869 [Rhizopus microsporus]CEI90657.1 hypothetical protein RMCBS344292_04975 [Rhizopus microsporus]
MTINPLTSATPPPPSTDFRNTVIENHWNDPPKKIFNKNTTSETSKECVDEKGIANIITSTLDTCKLQFQNGPQKRIIDDTDRRISVLIDQLNNQQLPQHIVHSLFTLTQALQTNNYKKALEIHTQLMLTEYDTHGNWITGLKRLIDLASSISA